MATTRTVEPFWWALFSAGGMISAMVFPVLIVLTGLLVPLGMVAPELLRFERVYAALAHPLVRLILLPILALPLFHWAHRFLYTLVELGLRRYRRSLAVLCYASAFAGAGIAALVLVTL